MAFGYCGGSDGSFDYSSVPDSKTQVSEIVLKFPCFSFEYFL
jgi:hypothetical protein